MTTAPTTTRPPLLLRVLVVFLAATAIWILLVWLNAKVAGGALNIPARVANAALISALVLPLVVGARRALDRRSWRGLGLQRGREGRRAFLIGLLAFLLPSALGLAVNPCDRLGHPGGAGAYGHHPRLGGAAGGDRALLRGTAGGTAFPRLPATQPHHGPGAVSCGDRPRRTLHRLRHRALGRY